MTKVFTAKSVDEAIAIACDEFGITADRIQFKVLEEPKKVLFKTIGEAKVEVSYEETKAEVAAKYVMAILEKMGLGEADVELAQNETSAVLNIVSTEFEELIGKKGEVLDSLQYLASLVSNKVDRDYFRISIDCGGFREKRKKQLEELAVKISENVKKNGRTSALEPMNPYERRIVHAVVSDIEGVSSRSVGDEPYRKVLISSTERKPYNNNRRDGGFNKGKRNNNNRRDRKPKQHFDITTSFEKDYKKPKPEDNMDSAGLYSKITF